MLTRREFLKKALAATAATSPLLAYQTVSAQGSGIQVPGLPTPDRPWSNLDSMVLNVRRNDEQFLIDLRQKGHWAVFRYLTRDVQAGVMAFPDPDLGGLLSWMQIEIAKMTGQWEQFVITSGLRTPRTNNRTEGAARNSMHLPDGNGIFRAVDLRMPGVSPKILGDLAWKAQEGGVGLYSGRGFVHLDTGSVRKWRK